jgi:hypothetical protein
VGNDFILIFRIPAMDMLDGGMSGDEVIALAKAVEAAGATIISTHFTWHEAQVPTIATMVPRAAFAEVTGRIRKHVTVPMITSNRINMPEVAEQVLAAGHADLVSMARPMLADADLVNKAYEGREDEINTCIACNQACLDHTFSDRLTSCLVNPRACHETLIVAQPAARPRNLAVVGAGPAGLAFATEAAQRGHHVTLYDAAAEIGGQLEARTLDDASVSAEQARGDPVPRGREGEALAAGVERDPRPREGFVDDVERGDHGELHRRFVRLTSRCCNCRLGAAPGTSAEVGFSAGGNA